MGSDLGNFVHVVREFRYWLCGNPDGGSTGEAEEISWTHGESTGEAEETSWTNGESTGEAEEKLWMHVDLNIVYIWEAERNPSKHEEY